MKEWMFLLSLLCLPTVVYLQDYPPEIGGGSDGVDGNEFLKGTSDTPKLEVSTVCSKSNPTSTTVDININIYMKDTGFKYSNIGPDDDKLVPYTCFFISVADYEDVGGISKGSCPSGNSYLTKVDSVNPLDSGFATRTFSATIENLEPTVSSSYTCGGKYDAVNSQSVFGVACKRHEDYDKEFDTVFFIYYEADTGVCLSRQLDAHVNVREPPVVDHEQKFSVTFKAYANNDLENDEWPPGPETTVGVTLQELSATTVELGTPIYFETCLVNDYTTTDSPYTQFFSDGGGPIGIYVKKCTAINDGATGADGMEADSPVTFIDNGCGLGVDPAEMIGKSALSDGWGFMYIKDTADSYKDWLRSPNCFRTLATPAVSFARAETTVDAKTKYECEIEYCTSSNDTRCFGDKLLDMSGYPACARRKRETTDNSTAVFDTSKYPNKVSLSITVRLPGFSSQDDDVCTEMIVISIVPMILAILMFVVIAVAGIMAFKLRSETKAVDHRNNSVFGFVNRGFYQ